MRTLITLWSFVRRDIKVAVSYRLQFFFQATAMLSICITFFFLTMMFSEVEANIDSLDKYGGSYFAFVTIGIAISNYVDFSLRTFSSSIRQAQMTGTFEAMMTTPASIGVIIGGSSLYPLLFTSFRSALLIFFGVFLFGIEIKLGSIGALGLVIILTVICTLALGIFSAGFIVLFHRGDPVTAAVSGLTWFLSGVIYPKEILPDWVQSIAAFLPVTHTLEALRLGLLQGASWDTQQNSIIGLALFAVITVPLSFLWFSWTIRRAKFAGALARY